MKSKTVTKHKPNSRVNTKTLICLFVCYALGLLLSLKLPDSRVMTGTAFLPACCVFIFLASLCSHSCLGMIYAAILSLLFGLVIGRGTFESVNSILISFVCYPLFFMLSAEAFTNAVALQGLLGKRANTGRQFYGLAAAIVSAATAVYILFFT